MVVFFRFRPLFLTQQYDTQLCQFCILTDTHLIAKRKDFSFHFHPDPFILKDVARLPGYAMLLVRHLCKLDQILSDGFSFTALPPKIKGMGTFPVRAVAKIIAY